jgi:hypothetical protein
MAVTRLKNDAATASRWLFAIISCFRAFTSLCILFLVNHLLGLDGHMNHVRSFSLKSAVYAMVSNDTSIKALMPQLQCSPAHRSETRKRKAQRRESVASGKAKERSYLSEATCHLTYDQNGSVLWSLVRSAGFPILQPNRVSNPCKMQMKRGCVGKHVRRA